MKKVIYIDNGNPFFDDNGEIWIGVLSSMVYHGYHGITGVNMSTAGKTSNGNARRRYFTKRAVERNAKLPDVAGRFAERVIKN